jgi:membrane protease subunit (stomatin/prohibitin family)
MSIFKVDKADIYFQGNNEDFVWKSPIEDFPNASKLTVMESQEALFYFNGACVGVLGSGMHLLETEKIPFLKTLINKLVDNTSMFHAEIYFVNKVELDMKWGTGNITYEDPSGPVFEIGCHGQMNLQAENSRKIVEKLVGPQIGAKRADHNTDATQEMPESLLTKKMLDLKFRDLLSAEINDKLLGIILENNIRITQLSAKLLQLSESLSPIVADLFDDYGFSLERFRITGVHMPEEDESYKRLKSLLADKGLRMSELQIEQQEKIIRAQTDAEVIKIDSAAQAEKRKIEGYDFVTEKQYEFLNNIATNPGTPSGLSSEMMQMGVGMGMMGTVAGMVGNMSSPYANSLQNTTVVPMKDDKEIDKQEKAEETEKSTDPIEALSTLKKMLDMDLIKQEEYDAKKQEILSKL